LCGFFVSTSGGNFNLNLGPFRIGSFSNSNTITMIPIPPIGGMGGMGMGAGMPGSFNFSTGNNMPGQGGGMFGMGGGGIPGLLGQSLGNQFANGTLQFP